MSALTDALARMRQYNSNAHDALSNPRGFGNEGYEDEFPRALHDTATAVSGAADIMAMIMAAADQQQAWGPTFAAAAGSVTYLSATRITVDAIGTDLQVGKHIDADCGADGHVFGVVSGMSEAGGITTVSLSLLDGGVLTPNLKSITTIDGRLIYVVDLETPVADAAASATSAVASKTAAAASQVAAAASQSAAAASAALAASYVAGTDPDQLVRAGDLGTAAWLDQTWLYATATWDAPSCANAAQISTTVVVPGAEIGDKVLPSASIALSGLHLRGEVTATDGVTLYLSNLTGSAVDLASATYYIAVLKRIPTR